MNTQSSLRCDIRPRVSSRFVQQPSTQNTKQRITSVRLAAILVLTLVTALSVVAQTDVFLGTWKMNPAKSKFGTGPSRKSETRIVVSSSTGMKVDVDRTNSDGTNQQFEYTTNLDGKSYPITGNGPYGADAISSNLTSPNTISSTLTRGGKVVGTGALVVSKDGKTLTISGKGTDEKGKTYSSVVVYDKQ
ncbi:MAG: hypothetical protein WAK48_31800 [Candidatus Acidiferrum sp.]|jgi:hypothetical protein